MSLDQSKPGPDTIEPNEGMPDVDLANPENARVLKAAKRSGELPRQAELLAQISSEKSSVSPKSAVTQSQLDQIVIDLGGRDQKNAEAAHKALEELLVENPANTIGQIAATIQQNLGGKFSARQGASAALDMALKHDSAQTIIRLGEAMKYGTRDPEIIDRLNTVLKRYTPDAVHLSDVLNDIRGVDLLSGQQFKAISDFKEQNKKAGAVETQEQVLKAWRTLITQSNLNVGMTQGFIDRQLNDLKSVKTFQEGLSKMEGAFKGNLGLWDLGPSLDKVKDVIWPKELKNLTLSGTHITGKGLKELKSIPQLEGLTLRFNHITDDSLKDSDDGLKELQNLPKLKKLDLTRTSITDGGLFYLKPLVDLKELNLSHTKITDAGLAQLSNNLSKLNLSNNDITDLEHLKGLTKLEELDLDETKIDGADLRYLRGLTTLTKLSLHGTDITASGLDNLKELSHLTDLKLSGTQIKGGLEKLKGLTSLTKLDLSYTDITDEDLESLSKLPNLKELRLNGTKITGTGLEKLKELTVLDLSNAALTGAGLEKLKGLTGLTVLDLRKTLITDAQLDNLANLTELRELDLSDTAITGAGLAKLKGLTHLTKLALNSSKVDPVDDFNKIISTGIKDITGIEAFTELKELSLKFARIGDKDLERVRRLPNLTKLDLLACTKITSDGFKQLKGHPTLAELDVNGTELTNADLLELGTAPHLSDLDVANTHVTADGVQKLKEKYPRLHVHSN